MSFRKEEFEKSKLPNPLKKGSKKLKICFSSKSCFTSAQLLLQLVVFRVKLFSTDKNNIIRMSVGSGRLMGGTGGSGGGADGVETGAAANQLLWFLVFCFSVVSGG
ncbi:hypothetical protein SLE2022_039570 [Rubroshorea leprosula]